MSQVILIDVYSLRLSFSVLLMGVLLSEIPVKAQEYPGCFIREPSGNVENLTQSVCGLFPTSNPLSANPTTPGVFQIPIKRRQGGIPVIDVNFNGQNTFEMLLDTGATGVVITPAMADALKVQPYGNLPINTASDQLVNQQVGRVDSINVGGLQMSNVEVSISPVLEIGLLGQGFFGTYDLTIKQDVIEFRPRA
ncbi:retropepsin-like aspartic protease family protein [Planktothrix mougeotii]|uniref:Clan AA aspartic protease n=1 Tax=Planktothrix mougeotii LEGE 06226 TaxID=1828728 RepID=A0ABR9U7L5_9CYAN|nr:retropepsin-like aspartic protease [Planktothrix mougeotii]MBE9142450.1 clan AA aspartic protease [Planktothrix mougeotii LEGE 06226]